MAVKLDRDKIPRPIQRAVEKIARDADLRFFMRSVLTELGAHEIPVRETEFQTSFALGRFSAARDLIETMNTVEPKLYPALLLEDAMGVSEEQLEDEDE